MLSVPTQHVVGSRVKTRRVVATHEETLIVVKTIAGYSASVRTSTTRPDLPAVEGRVLGRPIVHKPTLEKLLASESIFE